jgi:hypothetical protein
VTLIHLEVCPSDGSDSFIQLATYFDSQQAKNQLAKFNIGGSYIKYYQRANNGRVEYHIVVGPYAQSKAELKVIARRYEELLGFDSWIKEKPRELMRRYN